MRMCGYIDAPVNRSIVLGLDGTLLIDGLADHIENTAQSSGADGNHDGCAGILNLLATDQT